MAKRNHVLPYHDAGNGTLWLKRISRHMSSKYKVWCLFIYSKILRRISIWA